MRSYDSHRRRGRGGRKALGHTAIVCEVMMRALGASAEGAGMYCVLAAQHARSSYTPFAHLLSMDSPITHRFVDSLLASSTAQVYLRKSRE